MLFFRGSMVFLKSNVKGYMSDKTDCKTNAVSETGTLGCISWLEFSLFVLLQIGEGKGEQPRS